MRNIIAQTGLTLTPTQGGHPRRGRSRRARSNARKRLRTKKSAAQPLAARGTWVGIPTRTLQRRRELKYVSFAPVHIQRTNGLSAAELKAATGAPARSLEQEWLKQHRAEYAGSWIALEGAHLVAQGSSARQVLDAARARGCDLPLVVHIPSEPPLPFGGW